MRKTMLWAAALCALMLSACKAEETDKTEVTQAPVETTQALAETNLETEEGGLKEEAEEERADEAGQTQASAASLPVIENADLEVFLDLMGKSADEVAGAIGEGNAMTNEENILMSRDYSAQMFGHEADVTMSFNLYQYEENLLELCNISFADGSLEELKEQLIPILGEGEELSEFSYSWDTDTSNVILAAPFEGTLYIEISLNQ